MKNWWINGTFLLESDWKINYTTLTVFQTNSITQILAYLHFFSQNGFSQQFGGLNEMLRETGGCWWWVYNVFLVVD